MSANAPLGSPSRNTGNVEADCTSATQSGDGPSEVMSHAAATSFIHIEVLAAIQVIHNMRNTGRRSGAKAERESSESASAVSVLCSGMDRRRGLSELSTAGREPSGRSRVSSGSG